MTIITHMMHSKISMLIERYFSFVCYLLYIICCRVGEMLKIKELRTLGIKMREPEQTERIQWPAVSGEFKKLMDDMMDSRHSWMSYIQKRSMGKMSSMNSSRVDSELSA